MKVKVQAPTMNGNIIMVNFETKKMMQDFIHMSNINQYSVSKLEDDTFMVSTPVTKELEEGYLGMVHGARARAKDKEKPNPKPPTGGGNPDGTPPNGGTPGGTSVWEDLYTEARAA